MQHGVLVEIIDHTMVMSEADHYQPVQVQCHSGCQYADRPGSFIWQDTRYDVKTVEKQWLEPGERHFVVRTMGEKRFHICYHEQEDRWSLIEQ